MAPAEHRTGRPGPPSPGFQGTRPGGSLPPPGPASHSAPLPPARPRVPRSAAPAPPASTCESRGRCRNARCRGGGEARPHSAPRPPAAIPLPAPVAPAAARGAPGETGRAPPRPRAGAARWARRDYSSQRAPRRGGRPSPATAPFLLPAGKLSLRGAVPSGSGRPRDYISHRPSLSLRPRVRAGSILFRAPT